MPQASDEQEMKRRAGFLRPSLPRVVALHFFGSALIASFSAEGAPRRSATCAEVMAGFAGAGSVTRETLTAEERVGAQRIEQIFTSRQALAGVDELGELKSALKSAPALLEKDPESAVRAGVLLLFNGTHRDLALARRLMKSPLDFKQASLSESELAIIAERLRAYAPGRKNRGLLGMDFILAGFAEGKNFKPPILKQAGPCLVSH